MTRLEAMMGKLVEMAEFKAHCTRMLREVERDRETLTITVRGKPVAVVSPATEAPRESMLGMLKGTVTMADDLIDPVDPDWEAAWEAKWDERGYRAPVEGKP